MWAILITGVFVYLFVKGFREVSKQSKNSSKSLGNSSLYKEEEFTRKCFSYEWEQFLKNKSPRVYPNIEFKKHLNDAYYSLSDQDKKALLLSFLNVSLPTESSGNSITIKIGIDNDYSGLYNEIYDLLAKNRLNKNNIINLFQSIIREKEEKRKVTKNNNDKSIIDVTGQVEKINYTESQSIFNQNTTDLYFEENKLGNLYKDKLNLSKQEVSWLNRFWNPKNVFTSIEGCCIETIKLYLSTLKELNKQLKRKETTLAKEVELIKSFTVNLFQSKNSDLYRSFGYYDTSYLSVRTEADIYQTIFKRCENLVRTFYEHKRKLSIDFPYPDAKLINEFESRIGSLVNEIILRQSSVINLPDVQTEIELNAQNSTRWKGKLERIMADFSESNRNRFWGSVIDLGKLNEKNPSVENIFFEASKFISKYDKEIALKLYIYYLFYDLKSEKFDNKQLAKTVQKSLFKTADQLQEFENIANTLIKDKNLENALNGVSQIFATKRKKIKLDSSAIEEVQKQHSETVDLLNEYLQDEQEKQKEKLSLIDNSNTSEEVLLNIISKKNDLTSESIFINELRLNSIQGELVVLFSTSGFCIECQLIEEFAKTRGVFKNQLIESINEHCYEVLDDVLIEEDGEKYIINEFYYQKITSK